MPNLTELQLPIVRFEGDCPLTLLNGLRQLSRLSVRSTHTVASRLIAVAGNKVQPKAVQKIDRWGTENITALLPVLTSLPALTDLTCEWPSTSTYMLTSVLALNHTFPLPFKDCACSFNRT